MPETLEELSQLNDELIENYNCLYSDIINALDAIKNDLKKEDLIFAEFIKFKNDYELDENLTFEKYEEIKSDIIAEITNCIMHHKLIKMQMNNIDYDRYNLALSNHYYIKNALEELNETKEHYYEYIKDYLNKK